MSALSRRELLKRLLGCAATAATVVVAQAVLPERTEASPTAANTEPKARADELAEKLPAPPEGTEVATFVNRAFRNGGGFRNAGFRNGGFVNNAFRNGGFVNGGFRNAAFRNF